MFTVLGIYAAVKRGGWDIPVVRTVVDGGLLLIILLSMLVRRPFTLQYAREQVPVSVQSSPTFIKTNYILTAVWSLAMAILVVADPMISPITSSVGDRGHLCCTRRRVLVYQVVSGQLGKQGIGAS